MDRKQFINELRNRLSSLPHDEREKAISYYEEYFDDAGAENEDSVINELGDIGKIAQEIIENSNSNADSISVNKFNYENRDYTSKENNEKKTREKKEMKPIYVILIIIGALTIFPIVMRLFGLVMGLFGTIIGVVFGAFGIVISGIVTIFTIPFVGIAAIGTIIYNLGKGILIIALLIIIFAVIVKLVKAIFDFVKNREE